MAKSGPRSDLLFNNLSFWLGIAGVVLMAGYLFAMAIVAAIFSSIPKVMFITFAVLFWVEVALIGAGIYFTFIQIVRNRWPKVIAGLVFNVSAFSMLITFISVMSITGFTSNMLLLV